MAKKIIRVKTDELESGMETAANIRDKDSGRILLLKGTVLDSVMIFNLKERYSIGEVLIWAEVDAAEIVRDMKKEMNVRKSLAAMRDIFGSDEEGTISGLPEGTSEAVSLVSDDIIDSLFDDDNILLKMHQLQTYDDFTYKHCLRVAMISTVIGKRLNMDRRSLKELCICALLHDIGKRRISVDIITKPGRLTEEEYDEMKKHPQYGFFMLRRSGGYSQAIMNGVMSHHERFDGSGYPKGLSGSQIGFFGRILAVADVYDALTSNRAYRQSWSVSEAEEYIMGGAGKFFDYDVVLAFMSAFSPYPKGSKVILSDGRHAEVLNDTTNKLRPVIKLGDETVDLFNDFRYLTVSIKSLDKKAELMDLEDLEAELAAENGEG